MSPFLVCSTSLIISGPAPMESGLDILRWGRQREAKGGGGGGEGGGQKSISPSRKSEKAFWVIKPSQTSLLHPLFLLASFSYSFPRFPLGFFLLTGGYTFPLMCANNGHSSKPRGPSYLTKHRVVGSNPITGISPAPWNVIQNFCCLDSPI